MNVQSVESNERTSRQVAAESMSQIAPLSHTRQKTLILDIL